MPRDELPRLSPSSKQLWCRGQGKGSNLFFEGLNTYRLGLHLACAWCLKSEVASLTPDYGLVITATTSPSGEAFSRRLLAMTLPLGRSLGSPDSSAPGRSTERCSARRPESAEGLPLQAARHPRGSRRPCAVMRLCVTKIGVAVMVRSVKEGAEAFCFRQAL